jgi:Flp pilus assembly protein CpaB
LKRSNRLVLLIGVFLAIVAFVGILLLSRNNAPAPVPVVTTGNVVVATADIPLSTRIRSDQVTNQKKELTAITPGAFTDVSQVVGQIVRQPVFTGAQITPAILNGGTPGQITNITVPAGQRAISVEVDQVSGVGAVIKTGDYVDMIIGLQTDSFPVISINPTDKSVTVISGINGTSVKVLLQGMQVLGTLLPPPTEAAAAATPAPSSAPAASAGPGGPTTPSTALNGTSEIVVLSVTAQQAEVIRFAQLSGTAPLGAVSLVLRSPDDFIDPATGQPLPPVVTQTTGIILKTLVDSYGVLPPELIQTVTPGASSRP